MEGLMHLSPLQAVRSYYECLAPGRRAELMELLDPHVLLEIPEGFPGGRSRYEGLKAYLEDFLYSFYGTFDLESRTTEFLDAGENVVALGRFQGYALATGVAVDVPFAHIWTVRDGHLIRGRMFTDTACLCTAAGARIGAP
jgi:ketosteroid isomerase-like protein